MVHRIVATTPYVDQLLLQKLGHALEVVLDQVGDDEVAEGERAKDGAATGPLDDRSSSCYGSAVAATADARRSILEAGRRIMAHKGFAAAGLTEVLSEARVPKGSFYYYFESKDAFGEAIMRAYFVEYLADMDRIFAAGRAVPAADRLLAYLRQWRDMQTLDDCQGKCLAVKLGAEVADLSGSMRVALVEGTDGVVDRLERVVRLGIEDESLAVDADPRFTAAAIYDAWLGASILAKIHRSVGPLDRAMAVTRHLLHL